eukprot:m.460106 g.460106  ORF g.460106 m.460106 type:complete len:444 (-) comp21589_c1_seq8:214-1545(-)
MGICGSKPKTSHDKREDADKEVSRLSTVLTSTNSADNEKLEELQVVREPSYIEATLDQHGLDDPDAIQVRKSPVKRLSSSEALKITSLLVPPADTDVTIEEEPKVAAVMYLGKEVEWDTELCNSDPAAGFAKFLMINRIRPVDLYKEFDKEKSNQISTDTFVNGLLELGMPLDEASRDEKIAQLIASVDKDEDGKVSYAEFTAVRENCKLAVRKSSSVKGASNSTTPTMRPTPSPTRPRKSSAKKSPVAVKQEGEDVTTSPEPASDTSANRAEILRSPTSPTANVREEQKQLEKKKKKSVSKHQERQNFIKKQQQEKKIRAKHPKKNLREVMANARGVASVAFKRVHPYIDQEGAEAKIRRSSNPEDSDSGSRSSNRESSRGSSRKKPVVVRGESFHGTFIKAVDGRTEMSPTTLVRREQEIEDRNRRAAADLHQERMQFLSS